MTAVKGTVDIRRYTCKIDGRETTVTVNLADLDLEGLPEAFEVAGPYGRISEVYAAVSEALRNADADYRHWRGNVTRELREEGTAATLIKEYVDGLPAFLEHKATIASLERQLKELEGFQQALRIKGRLLESWMAKTGKGDLDGEDYLEPRARVPRETYRSSEKTMDDRRAKIAAKRKGA